MSKRKGKGKGNGLGAHHEVSPMGHATRTPSLQERRARERRRERQAREWQRARDE